VKQKRTHPILALLAVLCLGLAFAACGGDEEPASTPSGSGSGGESSSGTEIKPIAGAESKPAITVGSKNFTEQFILGEIYSQSLEAAGFKVEKQLNLGSELIAYKSLQSGRIDAYPEYTGTALTSFFDVKTADVPRDAQQAYEQTKQGFAEKNITALAATPFENTYRLGLTKEKAAEIGNPKVISDLAGSAADLSITGFPECKQRQDCLLGVQDAYGLKFGKFVSSEQKYQVLDSGDADVAFIFTTDGDLASGKYVVLDDDKSFFPPYNITFAIRNEALEAIGPEGQKVIETVQKPLTEKVMQELNARVDVDKEKPEEVAAAYLESAGFVPAS
jgi:glycine betaine/choline ABC-type transport system substrate-binding protein